MENPDLVLQETGSRQTYSRLNYVPSGDTLRRDAISSYRNNLFTVFSTVPANLIGRKMVSLVGQVEEKKNTNFEKLVVKLQDKFPGLDR